VTHKQATPHEEAVAEIVAQKLTNPAAFESAIVRIAEAMTELVESRMRFSTIVLLVSVAARTNKKETEKVLRAAMNLDEIYLKPEDK
jgi:hypothetical protein